MKKILWLTALTVVIAGSAGAQTEKTLVKTDLKNLHHQDKVIRKDIKEEKKEMKKLEGKEVSYQTRAAFTRDFGIVPGTSWTRGTYFDEAAFTKEGKTMKAFYDADGSLVGTTEVVSFTDLPSKAQDYINRHYSGFTRGEVLLFDDNEVNETDMILYGTRFDDEDNYFVSLQKDNQTRILQVGLDGGVTLFKKTPNS